LSPINQLFGRARSFQRAGDLQQARELYRQVVAAEAYHAEAWNLLAQCHQGLGEFQQALDAYGQALRLRPSSPEVHCGLGATLAALRRRDAACEHFAAALRLRPDYPDALSGLGLARAEAGRVAEALPYLQRTAETQPQSAVARRNYGVALAQSGRRDEALKELQEALALQPDYAEAHCNLGNVLRDLGRKDEAREHYRQAATLKPTYGAAFNNLGLSLSEAGRHAEAVVTLKHAVRLAPQAKEGLNNLGLALADLGRFTEAEAAYEQALRLDPGYAEAHANLGSTFKEQGRLDEALACYQIALSLLPQSVSANYNRALTLLQAGDYAAGWEAYEWRWQRPSSPMRPFPHPRWDGSPLEGKTILLWCEQGLGDAIHFVRYAPLVKARGGMVFLESPPELVRLFASVPGIDRVLVGGEGLPAFDVQVPLLSLPAVFGTTLARVPAEVPYLFPETQRREAWGQRLGEVQGARVGIVWQGNPRHGWDHFRSFPLATLAPLAAVEGVRLVSLQKGPGVEQLRALRGRFSVVDLGEAVDAEGGFVDTAAILQELDLLVCADTAVGHLAGALGVPVWLALSQVADWRWMVGRECTPWYPTMRMFRQRHLHDWTELFQRMACDLRSFAASHV
jgi:tetratricopeptide (TPR) repeat protein